MHYCAGVSGHQRSLHAVINFQYEKSSIQQLVCLFTCLAYAGYRTRLGESGHFCLVIIRPQQGDTASRQYSNYLNSFLLCIYVLIQQCQWAADCSVFNGQRPLCTGGINVIIDMGT